MYLYNLTDQIMSNFKRIFLDNGQYLSAVKRLEFVVYKQNNEM